MSILTNALRQIDELYSYDSRFSWPPPLTLEQIDEILKDYPYKLPKEIYELYLWRNGNHSLPSKEGTHEIMDFGDFLGYSKVHFLMLEDAMRHWKSEEKRRIKGDSRNCLENTLPCKEFALFTEEYESVLVTVGSEVQQDTAPVYWTRYGKIQSNDTPFYPSLTSMMLAINEINHEFGSGLGYSGQECDEIIRSIEKKYGRG